MKGMKGSESNQRRVPVAVPRLASVGATELPDTSMSDPALSYHTADGEGQNGDYKKNKRPSMQADLATSSLQTHNPVTYMLVQV